MARFSTQSPDPVARFLTSLSPRIRICLVIFGAVMIHLSLGTYHTFGNMLPYMASYMRNYTDDSIRLEQLIWIPTFQGCFPFAMVIGGYLSSRIGPRPAAALGCFLMSFGVLLSSWTIKSSYFSFLFTYGFMFGLGQGIAYVIAVSCVINWAPQMVGTGSGIVAAGFGISSSIFAPIQTRIVNIENFPPTKDGYFNNKELLERVPGVFFTLAVAYFIMQCIGLVFICDPPADFTKKYLDVSDSALIDMAWLSRRRTRWLSNGVAEGSASYSKYGYVRLPVARDSVAFDSPSQSPKNSHKTNNANSHGSDQLINNESDSSSDSDLDVGGAIRINRAQGPPTSFTPQQMLHSSTFYFLFVSLFCCSFYGNMFYNLYKTFGETFIDDDFFMAMAFSIGSVANACARIGWGFLTDKTSFQVSLSIATCLATILLLTMPLTALFGKYVYLLWLTLMFVCLAATHALFITAAVRCFGNKHKITNYGCLIVSTTLSGIVLAIGSEFFLQYIGYNWAFLITAAFPFTAFILTSAIRVTPQGHLIV
ncbi:major facilitator superfamily domain-containing protein [Ditylenchus destructor]|uniref:Major facilitator superfamily domain-containing protein n=1 Tax=Ditylenchus destructor TaxID=166010 RepID=A0AAD4MX26_9BILA|nr:major facilitator superfamily domain-containing protein [Ditylenchus destructor]